MSPAQIMVGDSKTILAKTLVPFVPADSDYHRMKAASKVAEIKLAQDRIAEPEKYNSASDGTLAIDGSSVRTTGHSISIGGESLNEHTATSSDEHGVEWRGTCDSTQRGML